MKASLLIAFSLAALLAAGSGIPEPTIIPPEAPSGEPEDWCATGRMSAEVYQQTWSWWRERAMTFEAQGLKGCQGLALLRLAQITENQDLSYLGVSYLEAALQVFDTVPEETGSLRAQTAILYARQLEKGDPAKAERLAAEALDWLRGARASEQTPTALQCPLPPMPEAQPGSNLLGQFCHHEDKAPDRDELRARLLDGLLSSLGRRSDSSHKPNHAELLEAVELIEETARSVRESTETTWGLTFELQFGVSRLGGIAARLGDAEASERALYALGDWDKVDTHFIAGGLQQLAKAYLERRQLDRAEEVLRQALRITEKRIELDAGRDRYDMNQTSRSLTLRDLYDLLELQHREKDLETLVDQTIVENIRLNLKDATDPRLTLINYYQFRMDDSTKALPFLDQLVEDRKGSAYSRIRRFEALLDAGQFAKAAEDLEAGIEETREIKDLYLPYLAGLLRQLGSLQQKLNRSFDADASFEESQRIYDEALAKAEGSDRFHLLIVKAQLARSRQHFAETKDLLVQAEQAMPTQFAIYLKRELQLEKLGFLAITGQGDEADSLLAQLAEKCITDKPAASGDLEECLMHVSQAARQANRLEHAEALRKKAHAATAWARRPAPEPSKLPGLD